MVITGWSQIAATLGVSVRTAQTLRLTAGLPVANLTPRTVVVPRDALAEWLAHRCATPARPVVLRQRA